MEQGTRRGFLAGMGAFTLIAATGSSSAFAKAVTEAATEPSRFRIGLSMNGEVLATSPAALAPGPSLTFYNTEAIDWLADRTGSLDIVLLDGDIPMMTKTGVATVNEGENARVIVEGPPKEV